MFKDGRKVDVLIFLEHKDRELEVACAIGKLLRIRYKLKVAIASTIFHLIFAAVTVRPKVIVTPGQGFGKGSPISVFRYIYGDSIVFCNLNMEQFLSSLSRKRVKPTDVFKRKILKHFCWGERYKQFLLENGVNEENIMITGKPVVSIMQNKMKDGGQTLKDEIARTFHLPVEDKWLFFPTSCGMVFSSDYHMRSRILGGWDAEKAWEYRDYMSRILDIEFQWIAKLSEDMIERCLIILRPHPSVSLEHYRQRLIHVVGHVPPNVHISKELSAQDWVIASDVCYVTLSTVSIDAQIIKKPVYRLEPIQFPAFLEEEDWFRDLAKLTSFGEFFLSVQNYNQYRPNEKLVLLDYIDSNLDGIELTAMHLAKFAESGRHGLWSTSGFVKALFSSPRRTFGSLLRFLLAIISLDSPGFIRPGLIPDYFDRDLIVKKMEVF